MARECQHCGERDAQGAYVAVLLRPQGCRRRRNKRPAVSSASNQLEHRGCERPPEDILNGKELLSVTPDSGSTCYAAI